MISLPWRVVPIDGGPPVGTSLTANEAQKLRELSTGKNVLEVGSAYGFSAIMMAQTARHVLAVDPHLDWLPLQNELHAGRSSLDEMRENLKRYGVEKKVSIVLSLSQDVLPMLVETHSHFDLIFIDGDHGERSIRGDVSMALLLLERGGVIACHDYGEASCPDVKKVLDMIDAPGFEVFDTLWVYKPC